MKSHVAMSACPICRKETGVLVSTKIMNGKLDEPFDQRVYIDPTAVCKECEETYLSVGIMLIDPDTVALSVIKEEAFKRIFTIPVPSERIAFMKESDMRAMGLIKEET